MQDGVRRQRQELDHLVAAESESDFEAPLAGSSSSSSSRLPHPAGLSPLLYLALALLLLFSLSAVVRLVRLEFEHAQAVERLRQYEAQELAPSTASLSRPPFPPNPLLEPTAFSSLPLSHHVARVRALAALSPPGGSPARPYQAFLDLIRDYHNSTRPSHLKLLYHARPAPLSHTDRAIVSFDGRSDLNLIAVLRHTLYLSGPSWGMVLFHTARNVAFFVEALEVRPGGWGEHVRLVEVDDIGRPQANALPTSAAFYRRIPAEHMLFVQADVVQLRSTYLPGPATSALWLDWMADYHYLGAPWRWCGEEWCRAGGNGGCSYRRRSTMLEAVATAPLRCTARHCEDTAPYLSFDEDDYEDVYLSHRLLQMQKEGHNLSLMLDQHDMARFAIESIDFPDLVPFFLHNSWTYGSNLTRLEELIAHAFPYYPE